MATNKRKPIVPQRIENEYSQKLRKVAAVVGHIIDNHTHIEKDASGNIVKVIIREGLMAVLRTYSSSLDGWAKAIAIGMLENVDRSNKKYWLTVASNLGSTLRSEVHNSAIGAVTKSLLQDQLHLIKSLPLEAGERAQSLALEATTHGKRASDIADMIQDSGNITKSRANTIARTEIHKAWSALTQSRAQYVGANQYIWRTAGDEIVRDSHAEMDGKVCDFNNPPTLSDGDSYNAGEGVNCRCYAEPIIGE